MSSCSRTARMPAESRSSITDCETTIRGMTHPDEVRTRLRSCDVQIEDPHDLQLLGESFQLNAERAFFDRRSRLNCTDQSPVAPADQSPQRDGPGDPCSHGKQRDGPGLMPRTWRSDRTSVWFARRYFVSNGRQVECRCGGFKLRWYTPVADSPRRSQRRGQARS